MLLRALALPPRTVSGIMLYRYDASLVLAELSTTKTPSRSSSVARIIVLVCLMLLLFATCAAVWLFST